MHKPYHYWLQKNDVSLLRKETDTAFDVLVIAKIYFFWEEETFFHTYTKICDSFHFLSLLLVTDSELRHPNTVDVSLDIFNDVVKNEIEEHEELHPHQFIMLTISYEHLYFRVLSV